MPPAVVPWKTPASTSHVGSPSHKDIPPPPPFNAAHMNPNAASFQPRIVSAQLPPATAPAAPAVPPAAKAPHAWLSKMPANNPPPIVTRKSDEEVLEILKKSTLKVNANVFIPGMRTIGNPTKPSPLSLTPSAPEGDMLLGDSWCMYHLEVAARGEDKFDPTLVFRIDSVATFWRTMNNIPEANDLPVGSTTFLFRDDIDPRWEDPKNINGGMWRFKVPASVVSEVWIFLCCRTVGESWAKEYRNTINGVVLKSRDKGYWLEVWVTGKKPEFPSDLLTCVESVLPAFNVDFFQHEDMQKFLKEAAEKAPKGKKGKKR